MVRLCDNQFDRIRCQEPVVLLKNSCAHHQHELTLERTDEASIPDTVDLSGESESSILDYLVIQQQPSIERGDTRCYVYCILAILSVASVMWLADHRQFPSLLMPASMSTSARSRRSLDVSSQVLPSKQTSRNVTAPSVQAPDTTIRNRLEHTSISPYSQVPANGSVLPRQSHNLAPPVIRNQVDGHAITSTPLQAISNGHDKLQPTNSPKVHDQSTPHLDAETTDIPVLKDEVSMLGAVTKSPATPCHDTASSVPQLVDALAAIPVPLHTQVPLLGAAPPPPKDAVIPTPFEEDYATAILSAPAPARASVSCGYEPLQNTNASKMFPLIAILFRYPTFQCFGSAPDDIDDKWPLHYDEYLQNKEEAK